MSVRTRVLVVLALSLVVALLAISTAPAAPKSGNGSAKAAPYSVVVDPAGPYSFGQEIYVTTDAPIYPDNAGPWIALKCSQNGVLVGTGDHAGFPDGWYYNWPFRLGPTQSWTSGAADCTVTVFHQSRNRIVTDAITSFHVDA